MEEHYSETEKTTDILEREERCRKSLNTVSKAIFMRLFVTVLLIWAVFQTKMEAWVIGLVVLVLVINLAGILPLYSEWKRQRRILREIIAQDEA